jgi:hypothetical protein
MFMTIPQRKAQFTKLIDSVKDPAVLDKVAKVLEKPVRQSALIKRALKAEEDLKAGRTHSWDEVSAGMDQLIDSLYSEKKKTPSRPKRSKRSV